VTDASPPPLHALESEVMDQVWSLGEATVHEVRDRINAKSERPRAYNTVMTVMSRLHAKGLLEKERRGRRDHFFATLSREAYLDTRAEFEVHTLVGQYGDFALAHFAAQMAKLDPERREKLRRLAQRD
jgi:predicted transcriptional regulator